MEPPPYDPTVRCLGRVLSDAEVDEHWCDRAILYRALASRSPDLAWAVLDGDRWRVMRLREINDNGLVIFVFGGQIRHGEWLVSIWEKAWPMLGFRVNLGRGRWQRRRGDLAYAPRSGRGAACPPDACRSAEACHIGRPLM